MSYGTSHDRAEGRMGRQTSYNNLENDRGLAEHRQAQTRKFYDDTFNQPFAGSSSTTSFGGGGISYGPSAGAGGGRGVVLVLGALFFFVWGYPYAAQITGDNNWAFVLTGVGYLGALGLLWLLFFALQLAFVGILCGLAKIWENIFGKIFLLTIFVVGGFYGADRFLGDIGIEYFSIFLVIVTGLALAYAALAWFARTKVGKVVIPTAMVGGIVAAGAYLYSVIFP